MPVRLNIGRSRKVGEVNFGSRGASANLEVEIESDVVRKPAQLHDKICYLFRLAKESVEEELSNTGNRHAQGNGNGHQRERHTFLQTD